MPNEFYSLDKCVLNTISFLKTLKPAKLDIKQGAKNVFIGSGNAYQTSRLFVSKFGGVALKSSDYKQFFQARFIPHLKDYNIHLVSASGGQDGGLIADYLNNLELKFNLLTCNENAYLKEKNNIKQIYYFEALKEPPEPPTYNTSTYASMISSLFNEDVNEVESYIKSLEEAKQIPNLKKYSFILFLSKDEQEPIANMCSLKIAETLQNLGSNASGFTNAHHGLINIQPNKKMLLFCQNVDYDSPEKYNLNINSYLGTMLATYYIIGKNQTSKEFKTTIEKYKQNAEAHGWIIRA